MEQIGRRLLGSVAALGWLGVATYGIWEMAGEEAGDGWQRPYMLFTASLALAVGATTALAWTYLEPLGRPRLRMAGAVVAVLAAASAMVAWAIPLWATLLAVSCVLAAAGAQRGTRSGLVVLAAAPVLGMTAMFVASAAELGREDSYGDYPAAFGVGNTTIAAGSLIGLAVLGLRKRRPASEPAPQQRRRSPATV